MVIYFRKGSVIDTWHGPKYESAFNPSKFDQMSIRKAWDLGG